jgi:type V secretory pathway adhesin AidA
MTKARGKFTVESGGEDAYEALAGGVRLTHAQGTQSFTGDIKGDGAVHWLMLYRGDKTAQFVGLQRISGTIGGRRGTVVLAAEGTHDGKGSQISLEVVPGSGSGDLAGLSGKGKLVNPGAKAGTYELDYKVAARPRSRG